MEAVALSRGALRERRASLVNQAVHQLRSWPALVFVPTTAGAVFTSGGHEIVRLPDSGSAHLHLTVPVIDRLRAVLCACTHLGMGEERGWVAVPVETSVDLDLLLALVSVAIKANE